MNGRNNVLPVVGLFVVTLFVSACAQLRSLHSESAWQERPALATLFTSAGVEGTILIHEIGSGLTWVHDPVRARRGFLPASTFKIVNSLIALDTGLVSDVDKDLFPYAGKPFLVRDGRFLPSECEASITLRTAFGYSCIPVYQELARRVGVKQYKDVLQAIDYGRGSVQIERVDWFWLEGGFKIGADEQVALLKRLYKDDLPFSPGAIAAVKDLMVVDRTADYVLRAKTGYVFSTQPEVGWYVGWLERGSKAYLFALNLDIRRPEDARARGAIVKDALKEIGAL